MPDWLRKPDPAEIDPVTILVVVGAVAAAFSGTSPTGWWGSDLAWTAGFAALFIVACARVSPVAWVALGVATVGLGVPSLVPAGLGIAATVLGAIAVTGRRLPTPALSSASASPSSSFGGRETARSGWFAPAKDDSAGQDDSAGPDLTGAAVGALVINGLLRLPDLGPARASAALVALLVVPTLWLAWLESAPETQVRIRRLALRGALVLAAVAVVSVGVVAALVPTVDDGIDAARSAAARARRGDVEGARDRLDRAADRMGTATAWFRSPLVVPARLLPGLGQQVRAVSTAGADAGRLAQATREAIAVVDDGGLEVVDGAIDLATVRAAIDPLERSVAAMERARLNATEVTSPWLLAPLADKLGELTVEVDDNLPAAQRALEGARLAEGFLGGDEVRRYFIAFTTPAESRFMGGFVAHYAEVEIDRGRMEITDSGHVADFHGWHERTPRELVGLDDHMARHGENYRPAYFIENITASPDAPTAAEVARQVVDLVTGRDIDVVVIMDPSAVAALGTLNAPIHLEGVGSLDMEGVLDFLLFDQYTIFPDEDEQRKVLDELTKDTLDAVLDGDLNLGAMVDRLGPLVEQGRLQVVSFDPVEDAFLRDAGLTRPFIRPGGVELVAVKSANASPNKLDVYLERQIEYEAVVDPATGQVEGTTTITMTNAAPPGLQGVVSGGWGDLPESWNRQLVSMYSEHQVSEITVDGEPVEPWLQTELGWQTASVYLEIPRGDTQVVVMRWQGQIEPDVNELVVSYQPTVNRDQVRARVATVDGDVVAEYQGRPRADVRIPFRRS